MFGCHLSHPRGGGELPLERGMCHHLDPLFQCQSAPLTNPFTINGPLISPIFNLVTKFAFKPLFWPKLQLSRCKFSKFLFPRLSFFKENLLPRHYFWKPVGTQPTKKLSAPPPLHHTHTRRNQNYETKFSGKRYIIQIKVKVELPPSPRSPTQ